MQRLSITRAQNDLIWDAEGRVYIDLFSSHGTTWLGHGNKVVTAAVMRQMEDLWITGGLESPALVEARTLVDSFFPPSHGLAALYSTGMEAAEFALRIARVSSKKNGAVGFQRGMHGKSLATAYLGWDNQYNLNLPSFHRLPFVPTWTEGAILTGLERLLAAEPLSAVFIEPLQGCGGGHRASDRFYQELFRLCQEKNALLVFDEILTGWFRIGPPFFFSGLGFIPDIILIGKSLGNGFPVSGVVVNRKHRITREMLPGSTYSGNPLAAAAVAATLRQFRRLDLPALVEQIENIIVEGLGCLPSCGISFRGKGALWVLELPTEGIAEAAVVRIYQRGVCVGYTGNFVRIMPPATIGKERLAEGCSVIREEIFKACHDQQTSG